MCFEPAAHPPSPPVDHGGLLLTSERRVLRTPDGAQIAARLSRTSRRGAPGVVILPDVRGLQAYYEELADRFADVGFHAVAIDPYARTAGPHYRDASFDPAAHRAAARDENLAVDVRRAVTELRAMGARDAFVLGFCFGGRVALMQASSHDVAGVIGFYGWPGRRQEGGSSPILEAEAGRVRAPVLALFGGADDKIPMTDIERYASALAAHGVRHRVVVYPGAPHAFFDRAMEAHAAACADAWSRVLAFLASGEPR